MLNNKTASDLFAAHFNNIRAGTTIEIGYRTVDFIFGVAHAEHCTPLVAEVPGTLSIDRGGITLRLGVRDKTDLSTVVIGENLIQSEGVKGAVEVKVEQFENADFYFCIQIEQTCYPI